jgi:hypothetical protein
MRTSRGINVLIYDNFPELNCDYFSISHFLIKFFQSY